MKFDFLCPFCNKQVIYSVFERHDGYYHPGCWFLQEYFEVGRERALKLFKGQDNAMILTHNLFNQELEI